MDQRMLPGDAKSQSSDYGSFCHTPSDTFGHQNTASNPEHPASEAGGKMNAISEDARDSNATGVDQTRQPLLSEDCNDSSSEDDAGVKSGYTRRKAKIVRGHSGGQNPTSGLRIDMPDDTDSVDEFRIKGEPIKTLLAFLFLIFAWVATTTSLALTHERMPDYKPLPDIFLDNVQYQAWGLNASEILIMISTMVAFLVSIFHKHRCIVLRRIFIIVGLHYYYRAITFYITVLPKPNEHYPCDPKLNHTTFAIIAERVLRLLSGMGLSINGKHTYCGDYIYSGHTMTLLMTYLVIKEYSPRKWFLLHWLSMAASFVGILCLLLARGHYSIDVLVAYWITTRMWWLYHTMANQENLKRAGSGVSEGNYLSNMWWWYVFRYFEGQVPVMLPREYGWPLPQKLIDWTEAKVFSQFRRRTLRSTTSEADDDLESGRPASEAGEAAISTGNNNS